MILLRRLLRRVCPGCFDGAGTQQVIDWLHAQRAEAERAVSPLERALVPTRRRPSPRAPRKGSRYDA